MSFVDSISVPSLPFGKWYTFIASFGSVVAGLSLFLETTFLPNRLVFEMGGVAVVFGIIGWVVEMILSDWSKHKNVQWQHVIRQTPTGESPYDYMPGNPGNTVIVAFALRIMILMGFILVETGLYLSY